MSKRTTDPERVPRRAKRARIASSSSSSSVPAPLTEFPLFPRLPPELRITIWELMMEPRIIRFDPGGGVGLPVFEVNRESRAATRSKYTLCLTRRKYGESVNQKTGLRAGPGDGVELVSEWAVPDFGFFANWKIDIVHLDALIDRWMMIDAYVLVDYNSNETAFEVAMKDFGKWLPYVKRLAMDLHQGDSGLDDSRRTRFFRRFLRRSRRWNLEEIWFIIGSEYYLNDSKYYLDDNFSIRDSEFYTGDTQYYLEIDKLVPAPLENLTAYEEHMIFEMLDDLNSVEAALNARHQYGWPNYGHGPRLVRPLFRYWRDVPDETSVLRAEKHRARDRDGNLLPGDEIGSRKNMDEELPKHIRIKGVEAPVDYNVQTPHPWQSTRPRYFFDWRNDGAFTGGG